MQLRVHGQNIDTTMALESHIEQRFESALDRVAHAIHRVVLRLKDVNGPRGGADKRAHLCVELTTGEQLFIEDRDRDLYHVVNRLAGRAKFVVKEHLKRRRDRRRRQ